MFSRKGVRYMSENVVDIVLKLIGVGVIVVFIIVVFRPGTGVAAELVCKWSVSFDDQFGNAIGHPLPNLCYTDDKKIEGKDRKDVEGEIAEHMRKCLEMWGMGEKDVVGKIKSLGRKQCFKCYRLKFSEIKDSVTAKNVEDFLHDKTGKKTNKETYWNYMVGKKGQNEIIISFSGPIKKDKYYAVTYLEETNLFGGLLGNADGVMFSEYDEVKSECGGYIK